MFDRFPEFLIIHLSSSFDLCNLIRGFKAETESFKSTLEEKCCHFFFYLSNMEGIGRVEITVDSSFNDLFHDRNKMLRWLDEKGIIIESNIINSIRSEERRVGKEC